MDSATLDVQPGRECESSADCDDNDACTGVETCGTDGRCRSGGAVECSPSTDTCRTNVCQPATGECELVAAHEADACDDGKLCTHNDACTGGACRGIALVCNDGLACTVDRCDESAAGCVFDDAACQCDTNADCDNQDACDGVETCGAAHTCQKGTAVLCEASTVACLRRTCHPGTGACELVDDDGAACDDGDPCTDSDRCVGGDCLSATKDCADAATCTTDACDGETGECTHIPDGTCECLIDSNCPDDGNVCNGSMTCATKSFTCVMGAPPGDGAACDDDLKCTGPDACAGTTCAGAPRTCATSADPCQINACDPATGTCEPHAADDATPCHDADACTQTDACASGRCVGSDPVECQPLSDCHDVGTCAPATGVCSNPLKPSDSICGATGEPGFCSNVGTCEARMLSAGYDHVCILYDGNVRCWGENQCGALGFAGGKVGYDTPASAAPLIDFEKDVVHVSAGGSVTCVVFDDGTARCWGCGIFGALGTGSDDDQANPLTAPDVDIGGEIVDIETNGVVTCALRSDNKLWCFGSNFDGTLGYPAEQFVPDPGAMPPVDLGTDLPIRQLSVGVHACVLVDRGELVGDVDNIKCWGWGVHGQLGYGTYANVPDPATVGFVGIGKRATAVQAGLLFTCALLEDQTLTCWGLNNHGQLGNGLSGAGVKQALPSADPIAFGGPVVGFAVVDNHACALESSGIVRCWGQGGPGLGLEIGEDVTTPLQVNAATGVWVGGTVLQLVAPQDATCALMDTGAVRCWGSAEHGVLGYGTQEDYGGLPGSMPPPNVPYK